MSTPSQELGFQYTQTNDSTYLSGYYPAGYTPSSSKKLSRSSATSTTRSSANRNVAARVKEVEETSSMLPANDTKLSNDILKPANPLSDLLTDELYTVLMANDLINQKALRDFMIRRIFQDLRKVEKMKTMDAIKRLQDLYPYLQTDTIRKIVYRVYPGSSRKSML